MVTKFHSLPMNPDHHVLTCENHPDLRWTSKGPGRSIFFVGDDHGGMDALGRVTIPECPCPASSLILKED